MTTVYMPIGLPGCGKSTYVRNAAGVKPVTVISSDRIRQELTGEMSNLSQDTQVWRLATKRFEQALADGESAILVDNTNLTPRRRAMFLDRLKTLQAQGRQVFLKVFEFTLTVAQCIERQRGRARQVPPEAIAGLARYRKPFNPDVEAQGLPVTQVTVRPEDPLPNPARLIRLNAPPTNLWELERFLAEKGFWQEDGEWCSARLAELILPPAVFPHPQVAVQQTLEALIQKGFARLESARSDGIPVALA
jgi:predicted kinase